jgi:hypothetical protein
MGRRQTLPPFSAREHVRHFEDGFGAVAGKSCSPQFHRKNADCDTPFAVWQFLSSYDLSDLLTAQNVIRIEIARHGDLHTGKVLP